MMYFLYNNTTAILERKEAFFGLILPISSTVVYCYSILSFKSPIEKIQLLQQHKGTNSL